MHQNSPVNQPFLKFCAVEHCPHKGGVTGLLPVPPSIKINTLRPFRRPSGQTPSGPRPPRTAAGSSRWSRVAEDHVEAGQGIAREELLNPAANLLIGGFAANPTQTHLLRTLRPTSPRGIPSQ